MTIHEIKKFLDEKDIKYKYCGFPDLEIQGFCALSEPISKSITWVKGNNADKLFEINPSLELLIVMGEVPKSYDVSAYNIIQCEDPKQTFFSILNYFYKKEQPAVIEADSCVETKNIGDNVSIGHHCYISKDVRIGNNVTIQHNVTICCPAVIGDNTIIKAGAVIGTSGFGFFQDKDGIQQGIAHFGGVKIGNNVTIGANTCIDRGTLADTVIGNNVKIDNLCHIGHNVRIGDNVLLIALSMLGGSSVIHDNAYIAPGAMIINQISVGQDAFIGMGAVVLKDVPENKVVAGIPAKIIRDNKAVEATTETKESNKNSL